MKNLLLFICVLATTALFAQDAADAPERLMMESIILEPEPENVAQLMENLAAHNKKYHEPGTPYEAYVYHITTGPNVGKLVWMMGPCNWSDLDNRPAAEGHDEDWVNNVVSLLEGVEHAEYWKLEPEMSKNAGVKQYNMYYLRYHSFDRNEGYRAWDQIKKIAATMKAMDEVEHWSVYDNMLRQGYKNGRHLVMVSGMDSWAEMDEDWPFAEKFEELYSRGEMNTMQKEMEDATTNSWDEIWTYDAKASGKEE